MIIVGLTWLPFVGHSAAADSGGDTMIAGLNRRLVSSFQAVKAAQVKLGIRVDPRFLIRQLLPALHYLPTFLWVAGLHLDAKLTYF